MQRKIVQIGNSSGIIIPSRILKDMGINRTDEVFIEYSRTDKSLVIKQKQKDPQ